MIKRLRRRLIAAAMLSLFVVLAVIMVGINVLNYRGIVAEADQTLSLLTEGDGLFPMMPQQRPGRDWGPMNDPLMSPELPYQSRFFSVRISVQGEVLAVELEHIAAVDRQTAIEYAAEVIGSGKEKGFLHGYRFVWDGEQIIFLDCMRELSTFYTFLSASLAISVLGMAAVFVLLLLVSGRIVKPVSESYEKQKQFITDAGHELKTPVTIIDADAEVLEMEVGENEWLQDIRKQTKRLGALTSDLTYLSRMEEQPRLQKIEFPVSDVVIETAQSFGALARTQEKNFILCVEPMLSMSGDEKAIRQLVSILLDNAVKYTPTGGEISLSLVRQGKMLCLTVVNTAEGVDKNELPHFFDRFYRADKSRNSGTGGYGIGLSIAKAVVTAHKGKIQAMTANGASLCIQVSLPEASGR